MLVALYYGVSGIACAVYYRNGNARSAKMFWLRGVWPLASAVFVCAVALAQLLTAGWRADLWILVLVAVGVVPMLYYRRRYASVFYSEALEHDQPQAVSA